MAVCLGLVAVLALLGLGTFTGGGSGGGAAIAPGSILSTSSSEAQLKLCAEGRNSTYGNPPTPAQQAACLVWLNGQLGGASPSAP